MIISNASEYREHLPEKIKQLENFSPESIKYKGQSEVNPYGISFVIGIPLLQNKNLEDYKTILTKIKEIIPNQYFYPNNKLHISLNVTIRPTTNGHNYHPTKNKQEYYKEYIDILKSIQFKPFSLKLKQIFPNGILLWEPVENPDAVFNIRKQIREKLLETKGNNPDLYFDMKNNDPIIPDIIHTTFLKPFKVEELISKLEEYKILIQTLNQTQLLSQALKLSETKLIETHVDNENIKNNQNTCRYHFYKDSILSTQKAQ